MDEQTETVPPIEVPLSAVPADTLRAIIEEFVLREGTDYGAVEAQLATKIDQVLAQLKRGDAKLYFDPESESVTLNPSGRRG